MKIDLLGNVVMVDEISLDDDLEICNGTIIVTKDDVAINASKLKGNIKIINNQFFVTKKLKWKDIKHTLKRVWKNE